MDEQQSKESNERMRGGGLTSQKARDQPAKFDLVFKVGTQQWSAPNSVFLALSKQSGPAA